MSEKMRRALESMVETTESNTPRIETKLLEAGVYANPAVVFTAAKYFEALDKLSKE